MKFPSKRLKCRACRLELCLAAGMRRDKVLAEEEKKVRFRKLLAKTGQADEPSPEIHFSRKSKTRRPPKRKLSPAEEPGSSRLPPMPPLIESQRTPNPPLLRSPPPLEAASPMTPWHREQPSHPASAQPSPAWHRGERSPPSHFVPTSPSRQLQRQGSGGHDLVPAPAKKRSRSGAKGKRGLEMRVIPRFLSLVKDRPSLWNKKSPDYKDKAVQGQKWQELAALLRGKPTVRANALGVSASQGHTYMGKGGCHGTPEASKVRPP